VIAEVAATVTGEPSLSSIATAALTALATVGSGLAALYVTWTTIRQARSRTKEVAPEQTVEERLDELSKSMRRHAQLVTQISAELEARALNAKQLQQDAKAAEALAGIHKEQADAIRQLMDSELACSERRIRRDALIVGISSFIAGGGVSYLVTLLH
jgi:methyl-accepting chemotaxis protein